MNMNKTIYVTYGDKNRKFTIEKNIPLGQVTNPPVIKSKKPKYPFEAMEVGDSLYIPPKTYSYQLLWGWFKKRKRKFVSKQDGVGLRIWRVK